MINRFRFLLTAFVVPAFAFAAGAAAAQAATTQPAPVMTESVPPQIDAAFAAWDVDKNGTLSLQEFKNGWMEVRRAMELQARLHTQFNIIDADKSGGIDGKEYANLELVKKAGKSAPPLSSFDSNKNQRLEFPEYLDFVKRMTAPKTAAPAAKSP